MMSLQPHAYRRAYFTLHMYFACVIKSIINDDDQIRNPLIAKFSIILLYLAFFYRINMKNSSIKNNIFKESTVSIILKFDRNFKYNAKKVLFTQ